MLTWVLLLLLPALVATFVPPAPDVSRIFVARRFLSEKTTVEAATSSAATTVEEEEDTRSPPLEDPLVVEESSPLAEESSFVSLVEGMEVVIESAIENHPAVEGRGLPYLFKARCEVPGAAVMCAFDEIRERAKDKLVEPGFRPGDVPPWIKRQLTEFAITTVMEDLVKFAVEAHDLEILEGDDAQETVKWVENPEDEAKTYILGDDYTFHAAFNATLPATVKTKADSGGTLSVDTLYKLTPAMHARANSIKNAGGKLPNLLQRGGGSSGSSKKKKSKSAKKNRKR